MYTLLHHAQFKSDVLYYRNYDQKKHFALAKGNIQEY